MAHTNGAFAPKLQFARPKLDRRGATSHRQRSPLSRDKVVGAAIDRLQSGGEEAMGINKLARSLGVKPPSLYNHVHGADDLRRAVAIEGWRRLYEELGDCGGHLDAHDALRSLAMTWRAFVLSHPNLYRVMAAEEIHDDDTDFASVSARGWEVWIPVLEAMGFEGDSASLAWLALRASLHGFLMLEGTRRMDPMGESRGAFEWMVETLAEDFSRRGARLANAARMAC